MAAVAAGAFATSTGPRSPGGVVCAPDLLKAQLSRSPVFFDRSRDPYEPMPTEVTAIRRLRVSAGVQLPTDTEIHVICGSKDVIHSWAIPCLGIKIDCIPGFSSHRRLYLQWRGAFWGQCMEVCGRYHHWMPILVQTAHKDQFLAWCLSYLRLLRLDGVSGAYTAGLLAAEEPGLVAYWEAWLGAAVQRELTRDMHLVRCSHPL